jgi:poly(A) polymerase
LNSCTEDFGADIRLAALFHDIGKAETFSLKERIRFDHHAEKSAEIVGKVFTRLQMPGERIRKIQWIIEHHMMMDAFAKLSDERKAHWYFHPWFKELLQLFWLDIQGTTPTDTGLYDSIIDDYDAFLNAHPRPAKPLLKGGDVMEILSIGPGEEVGRALQMLHDAQVRKDITTKSEAKAYLKEYFQKN